jgi:signal transduction histidine kinase
VPERERDRVFEMYRRLHPRGVYPGHGVGLAVCKRIVQRHGGRIWIDEGPAGGSAVHVVVP